MMMMTQMRKKKVSAHTPVRAVVSYRGADKSLARPGREKKLRLSKV